MLRGVGAAVSNGRGYPIQTVTLDASGSSDPGNGIVS